MRVRTAKRTTRVTPVLRSRKPSMEEKGRGLSARLRVSFMKCTCKWKKKGVERERDCGSDTSGRDIHFLCRGRASTTRLSFIFARPDTTSEFQPAPAYPDVTHPSPHRPFKGASPQNLSYGQLFLKPLLHLNSISFSFKQGQRFFPIIIHDSCNDLGWLILSLRRHTTTCACTIQTLLDHPLGRAKGLLRERKKSRSVVRGATYIVRSPPP